MKYKFTLTPHGWLFASMAVALLGTGGWLSSTNEHGMLSNVLLVLGLLVLVGGWIRTATNVRRINKGRSEKQ